MRSILTLTFLLLTAMAHAQEHAVRGTVVQENGSPLPGAGVLLDGVRSTATDALGRFVLQNVGPGEHLLTASFIGYQRQERRFPVNGDVELEMRLVAAPIELKEVSVQTGNGGSRTGSISLLDSRTRPVNNSQELLQLVPGLFVAQHAGGGKAEQIFFRGFDVDHGTDLQVSVDGLPVNMVSHAHGQGYADLHFTMPETMDRLVVHKGPYDARFGDFATSGTVEFHTRNSIDRTELRAEYGMFNTARAVGLFNLLDGKPLLGNGKENAYIAGEYAFTDAYFDSKQDFGRFNLMGKYHGQLNGNNVLTVSGSTFGAAWNASGQIPERAVASGLIGRFGAIDDDEGGETSRSNAYATLSTGLPNGGMVKNQLYYVRYDFNLWSNFTFFAADSVNGDMIAQTDHRGIWGWQGQWSAPGRLAGLPFSVQAGAGVRYDAADISLKNAVERTVRDTIVAGRLRQLNGNAWATGQWELSERFTLEPGLRFDLFRFRYDDVRGDRSQSGDAWQHRASPKLSLLYAASPGTQLYLRTGMGFHSNDARAVVLDSADATLPKAYGVDVGSTFKPAPRVLVNAALWGLWLESELVYVGDGGVVETSDPTQRLGADLSVRWQLAPKFFADLDMNYAHGRLVGPPEGENAIPLAPRFTTIGGLACKQEHGLNASLRYRHIGSRPANESGSVTAEGYFLLDATASWRTASWEVGASAENLLNTEWNQAQFDTESRLPGEPAPVSELHFTPGTPFFLKGYVAWRPGAARAVKRS